MADTDLENDDAAPTVASKADKPFVLCQFPGSDDPGAQDPVFFAHNNIPFQVPRETPFCIEFDKISHLMKPEIRLVSKQDPKTGEYRNMEKKVAFNRPEIERWLTAKEAAPFLKKQREAANAERAEEAAANQRAAQSA